MNEKEKVSSKKDISWKQYRKEKKLLQQKWKEEKVIKKLEKQKKKEREHKMMQELKNEEKGKGRSYTVSIAVPGSILENAQTAELQIYLAGQIARAASIFNVDEIVVYDETASLTSSKDIETIRFGDKGYSNIQLLRILQYLECPQYLRKDLILLHPDLKLVGLLNPLDSPHHLRATDKCKYREGVTTSKPVKEGKGSYVKVGLQQDIQIDKALEVGTRVTVQFDPDQDEIENVSPNQVQNMSLEIKKFQKKLVLETKHLKGVAVSPSTPRTEAGLYWGYTVRLATSLSGALTECPFRNGYDVIIGTSDKGNYIDDLELPPFQHLLIVFGGLKGLEGSLESDEMLNIEDPAFLFHHYLNTCPNQGSRTIRTEEAILISLAGLRPKIWKCQKNGQTCVY